MFRNKIKKINNSYEDSESPCTSVVSIEFLLWCFFSNVLKIKLLLY